jgi:hypothetical protein
LTPTKGKGRMPGVAPPMRVANLAVPLAMLVRA